MKYKNEIVVIEKGRWPFAWLYDLPWWKIEHWEENIVALQREIEEEIWLNSQDFQIEKIFSAEEDFVKHVWEWEEKDEHIIAIIYIVNILKEDFDLNYIEKWWDAKWFKLISPTDNSLPKTNILKKVLYKLNN